MLSRERNSSRFGSGGDDMRAKMLEISKAASDTAAVHALLIWLDTLPPQLLIAAEGRRAAGMVGKVTSSLPTYRASNDPGSTVGTQVDSNAALARVYWEHPGMMYSGVEGES